MTTALLHNAVYRGESQARSLANFLGSEERLEDFGSSLGVHADAGVTHGQHDVSARNQGGVLAGCGVVQLQILCFQTEAAASGHGIAGIDSQIHDDLFHLHGVCAHKP